MERETLIDKLHKVLADRFLDEKYVRFYVAGAVSECREIAEDYGKAWVLDALDRIEKEVRYKNRFDKEYWDVTSRNVQLEIEAIRKEYGHES